MIKLNLAGDALPAGSIDHNMVYHPDLDLYEAINSPGFEKPRTYEEAEAAIAALNKQSWGGFSDWRLPDDTEAQVPVDRTRYSPACDTSVYPDAVSDWYWTGVETTWSREEMRTGASRSFFVVCMDDGNVDDAYADVRFRARPVRRGDTAMSKRNWSDRSRLAGPGDASQRHVLLEIDHEVFGGAGSRRGPGAVGPHHR